jgi:hypothetical protein
MATSTSVSRPEYPIIISRWLVRVLPAPPRSPAQLPFPGAVRIVFNFPRLCRRRLGMARSLSRRIGQCRHKCSPSLWPRQTFSRWNSRSQTETGSNVGRDRFESQCLAWLSASLWAGEVTGPRRQGLLPRGNSVRTRVGRHFLASAVELLALRERKGPKQRGRPNGPPLTPRAFRFRLRTDTNASRLRPYCRPCGPDLLVRERGW